MKRISLAFLLLALTIFLYSGQETVKLNAQETKTVKINGIGHVTNLTWDTVAQFPQVSKTRGVFDNFRVEGTDFLAINEGGTFSIEGASLPNILIKLDDDIDLLMVSGYRYPSLRVGFWANWINAVIGTNSIAFKSEPRFGSSYFRNSVIGYRIDGGELKPVYYHGELVEKEIYYGTADLIEIFTKDEGGGLVEVETRLQKIQVEPKIARITFYSSFPFPEK